MHSRGDVRAEQSKPLDPRERHDAQPNERERLVSEARSANRPGDQPNGEQEDRIRRVFGHDDAGVGHRRDENGHRRHEQRSSLLEEETGQKVGGYRCDRHQERIRDEGRVIRPERVVEDGPCRRDQRWIHLAPTEDRHTPYGRPPTLGDVLGEIRVHDLVGQDPRRGNAEPYRRPRECREADDARDPQRGNSRHGSDETSGDPTLRPARSGCSPGPADSSCVAHGARPDRRPASEDARLELMKGRRRTTRPFASTRARCVEHEGQDDADSHDSRGCGCERSPGCRPPHAVVPDPGRKDGLAQATSSATATMTRVVPSAYQSTGSV